MKAISTKELTKTFGTLVAVDHISFEVEEGEVFGLLGLNGAGKTTTVLMLATLRHPTSGTATVFGHDTMREKNTVRKFIGLVFEEQAVDIYLTGRQNLDLHARMYNLPKKDRKERINAVLEAVGLAKYANAKVKDYSGGMVRRLEIARGMLTYPKLLLLDEPTIGVDVQTRRYLWDYVKQINKEMGTTVLLTTSYIEEADYLCHRVAIVDKGKLVVTGTTGELKTSIGENLISLKLSSGLEEGFIRLIQDAGWVKRAETNDDWLELSIKESKVGIPEVVRFARSNGFTISSINSRKPSLNDVLLYYTGRKIKEGEP